MQNKPVVQRVAANVRAELARKHITQTELAAKMAKSQPFVSRRLSGRVAFDISDLATIAAVLDVPMTVLVEVAAA